MANEFQRAITTALAQYIAAECPSLLQVTPEWPTANTQLKYPSLTVLTVGEVRFVPLVSSVLAMTTPVSNESLTTYLCGHFEPKLQLDLWAANKVQRATQFELIWRALNPDARKMGVRIQLANYFNEWASFSVTGYQFLDGNEQTQRQEWRCSIRVDALCNAVAQQTEKVMSQVILAEEPTANYNEEL